MTSTIVSELPPANPFLNSVSPGFSFLDHNVHYSLKDRSECTINWPITGTNTTAKLHDSYLNIARPPLSTNSNESNTYVSLPYHVTHLFRKIVDSKDKKSEGNMHIGANVNALNHDPFKIINLNPGCITNIIEINNTSCPANSSDSSSKNPFNKLTNNFNKLLKFTTSSSNDQNRPGYDYHSLSQLYESKVPSSVFPGIIDKILSYNPDTYSKELQSSSTAKLLISSHVNVLNVIAIGSDSNFKNTKEIVTTDPVVPYQDEAGEASLSTKSIENASPANTEAKKVIEEPLLRIQFRSNSIITSIKSFLRRDCEPIVTVGLDSGEVVIINLVQLKYQVFDDLGLERPIGHHLNDNTSIKSGHSGGNQSTYSSGFGNIAVTTIEILDHPEFEFLIVAGYANGEVMIINPYAIYPANEQKPEEKLKKSGSVSSNRYTKKVVGVDAHVTYFKKFDLSLFPKSEDSTHNEDSICYPYYLVGHFKVSHKPVTAIASTIQHKNDEPVLFHQTPLILAIACDDGLVRFLDLMFTYHYNYGDKDDKNHRSILTDTISNYFNDGITDIEFSPDLKFFCVVGSGDMIEIFKMTYYNVNGLLSKNTSGLIKHHSHTNVSILNNSTTGRRSRSGTVNSVGSSNAPTGSPNLFLSPYSNTPANSVDISRNESSGSAGAGSTPKNANPPIMKDIQIIARLKSHSNTVRTVKFVKDNLFGVGASDSTNNSVYKLISCGFDGKVIIWEFDYKALSKLKQPKSLEKEKQRLKEKEKKEGESGETRKSRVDGSKSPKPIINHAASLSPIKSPRKGTTLSFKPSTNLHTRTRSINTEEFTTPLLNVNSPTFNNLNNSLNNLTNGGTMNMNTILNSGVGLNTVDSNGHTAEPVEQSNELIYSFYKSLYDIRSKRHYRSLTKNSKPKTYNFGTLFHPITDDKLVPSIDTPLLSLDLSKLVHDGKIDGFHLDPSNFWCYGKNGDIFRYVIS